MNHKQTKEIKSNTLKILLIPFIIFWAIAVISWRSTGNIFILFHFGYLGTSIVLGAGLYILLPRKRKPLGRRVSQLLVGVYILCFISLLYRENFQLESLFFYLLTGIYAASAIHYLLAKIAVAPVIAGRVWCGWCCWTAMVLDFLPYKRNREGRLAAKWEKVRYFHFAASLCLVFVLSYFFGYRPSRYDNSGLLWIVTGNAFYFVSGILLAFALKDNRAFCKYLCPITAILKTFSRFALQKIEGDREKCTQCGACVKACPMDINIMEYVKNGQRVLSTECINCLTCTTICPEGILRQTFKLDMGGKEILRRR